MTNTADSPAQRVAAALAADELELRYQPRIDLISGTVIGAEALLRWRHPARGLLGASEFLDAVEGAGVMAALGRWVLNEACLAAAAWPLSVPVSVNVDGRQLAASCGLLVDVEDALRASGLPASRLTVEITEQAELPEDALDALTRLRTLGVGVSIDDFGAGQAWFSRLLRLPITELKLDRCFAQALNTARGLVIMSAMVDLARSLDVELVIEGIETGEQAKAAAKLGCRSAQGFHFAPALTSDALCLMAARRAAA